MAGNIAEQSSLPATPSAPISALHQSQISATNSNAASEKPAPAESIASVAATASPVNASQPLSSSSAGEARQSSLTSDADALAASTGATEEGKEKAQSGVQQLQTEGGKAHGNTMTGNITNDVQVTAQVTAQSESGKEGKRLDSEVAREDVRATTPVPVKKDVVQDPSLNALRDVIQKQGKDVAEQSGDGGQEETRKMEKDNLQAVVVNDGKRGYVLFC